MKTLMLAILGATLLTTSAAGQGEFLCEDALEKVGIGGSENERRLVFGFKDGYEHCEDYIRRVVPLVIDRRPCIGVEFLGGARLVFCAAPSLDI